jgi:DNA-binding MarR family transcriptional regulator
MKTKSGGHVQKAELNGEAFRLEDFLPYRLSVAANNVARLFARHYAESYGLSIPEWRTLAIIGRFGTLSPSAVGEWTEMDKVKVSRAAASLVARGMVKQTQDPKDGRGRLLRLTRRGAAVHQGMVPLACGLEDQLAEGMTRTEWGSLLKALDKLATHAKGVDGIENGAAAE